MAAFSNSYISNDVLKNLHLECSLEKDSHFQSPWVCHFQCTVQLCPQSLKGINPMLIFAIRSSGELEWVWREPRHFNLEKCLSYTSQHYIIHIHILYIHFTYLRFAVISVFCVNTGHHFHNCTVALKILPVVADVISDPNVFSEMKRLLIILLLYFRYQLCRGRACK